MTHVARYDIAAAKNIMATLKKNSPGDHARLVAILNRRAGLAGMGTAQPQAETQSWWQRILDVGTGALETIANYKLQERYAKEQQDQYEAAAKAELERQRMLAEQAKTRQMEYQQMLELQRQTQELERAAEGSLFTVKTSLLAVGGLVGLWAILRASR